MKNDLDHFRKFSVIELISNQKKFREYLEFTKKNDLISEKITILENLVNYTNEKSISANQNTMKLLTDLTISCTFCIIHSDFEVENFFKIKNFSFNFQKSILMQAINQCNERYKDRLENITSKFHFWVLLFVNKNIFNTLEFCHPQSLFESEINESLSYLQKQLENNEFINNNKIVSCKMIYELGLNLFLNNKYEKAYKHFKLSQNILNEIEKKNFLYFTDNKLQYLLLNCENPIIYKLYEEIKIDKLEQEKNIELEEYFCIFEGQFFKEKEEKVLFNSNVIQLSFENLTLDETKIFEFLSIYEIIKYCKNSIIILNQDCILILILDSKLKETKALLAKVKEVSFSSDKKYRHLYSEEKQKALAEQKFLMKENSFQNCLVELIEKSITENDLNLSQNFLKSLSQNILNNNLTDDMIISGLIHSLLINFKNNFKEITKYFNDFVEYFEKFDQNFGLIKINQIKFINLFIVIVEEYYKNHNLIYTIEGKVHNNLVNLVFFWLQNIKDDKITRGENILQILIKSIKRIDCLRILKHLILIVLNYVIDKRGIMNISKDDIYDVLTGLDPKIFKLDLQISEIQNIFVKEDGKLIYNFESNNLEFYEAELFNLLHKIEKKIREQSNIPDVEFKKRKFNLYFLAKNYSDSIMECTKYLDLVIENFKKRYLLQDILENLTLIDEFYNEFKRLLDYSLILKYCYCLYRMDYSLEAAIIFQYTHKIDYDLAYKLIKKNSKKHNIGKLEYIWKLSYFELLANIYYKEENIEYLNIVTSMIKRTSNHQYFKKNAIRRHFKMINFFKIIENFSQLFGEK